MKCWGAEIIAQVAANKPAAARARVLENTLTSDVTENAKRLVEKRLMFANLHFSPTVRGPLRRASAE
jgi:hypothetical protein